MQARVAPAREGWFWVKQGWQLFRRQPLALTAVLTTYFFAMLVVGAIVNVFDTGSSGGMAGILGKAVGGLAKVLFVAIVPGVTAGVMEACKRVTEKRPVQPSVLLEPFRETRTRRNLLILGLVQVVALTAVVAITPDFQRASTSGLKSGSASRSHPAPAPAAGRASADRSGSSVPAQTADTADATDQETKGSVRSSQPPETVRSGAASTPKQAGPARALPNNEQLLAQRKDDLLSALVQLILYLPITVALWYAPMLVYWHGIGPGKAIFFSAAAIWQNRRAFAVYSLALAMCLLVASYSSIALLPLLGRMLGGKFLLFLLVPLVLFLFTWFYCTVYVTYTEVFVRTDETETGIDFPP